MEYVVSTFFLFVFHFVVTASLACYPSPFGYPKKSLPSPWSKTRCNPRRNKEDIFRCALIPVSATSSSFSSSDSSHANITPIPTLTRGPKTNLLRSKTPIMYVIPPLHVSRLYDLPRGRFSRTKSSAQPTINMVPTRSNQGLIPTRLARVQAGFRLEGSLDSRTLLPHSPKEDRAPISLISSLAPLARASLEGRKQQEARISRLQYRSHLWKLAKAPRKRSTSRLSQTARHAPALD